MSSTVSWLIRGQVLFLSVKGDVSLDDVRQVLALAAYHLDTSTHPHSIHVLIDTTGVGRYPREVLPIRQAGHDFFYHPNIRQITHVSDNYYHHHMAALLAKIAHLHWKTFSTWQAAQAHLNGQAVPPVQTWSQPLQGWLSPQ